MSALALPLFSAVIAGCVHALEADHMAAVTTFVARRPQPAHAFGFGVRWGLGHSLALLIAGGALIVLDLSPPAQAFRLLEAAVGLMLVGLGLRAILGRSHRKRLSVAHRHAHAAGDRHSHLHGTSLVGAAHGLAGTAGFLALVPATMLASPWHAGAYLASFGLGTMLAMGLYALGAGILFHRAGSQTPAGARVLRLAAGAVSVLVGCVWILRAGL